MNDAAQLFDAFMKPGKDAWVKAASSEINGENPFDRLKWVTEDKQEILPYYTREDTASISYLAKFQPRTKALIPWANSPQVRFSDESEGNKAALEHLQHEAEGLFFVSDLSKIQFQRLLEGVQWEHCTVSFAAEDNFPADGLVEYIKNKNLAVDKLQGALFWRDEVHSPTLLKSSSFRMAGLTIPVSTPVNEVKDAIRRGVQTIEKFIELGYEPEVIFSHVAFSMPVGTQLLPDISKLKALRLLWYQVAQAFGVSNFTPDDLYVHGRSEAWIDPKYQPHGNMLKSTIAAIAAVSGTCNAITIQAEDETNTTMVRIARNTTTILREESHFGKVSDPFGGAYGVDILVDQIARDAWAEFQNTISEENVVLNHSK